ncbi:MULTISPECIES: recombinase family protein [Enterobacteriaceae]|uniref:Recombinase family protein n=4 Tax=Enterobacterales TaxID=91347 RepID=A0A9Q9P2Z5_ECOLX|nr:MULTISPECIES: helix-turn-helix domain-containing protein [Enterobacteriaceae]MCS6030823.1 recombinase family protein [Klebsiella quasipneumoniae subsp. quasipneumoniae]UYA94324.1 recombinase family protein [Escherichia coli]
MGSCAAPSAKGDDKFITTDYLQQCREIYTHLMAIFSSFERNRNIERTRSGLAAARARGRVGGRKPSLSEEDVKQIRILLADPEMTVGAVAKRFNVSRMTIYRYTTKS